MRVMTAIHHFHQKAVSSMANPKSHLGIGNEVFLQFSFALRIVLLDSIDLDRNVTSIFVGFDFNLGTNRNFYASTESQEAATLAFIGPRAIGLNGFSFHHVSRASGSDIRVNTHPSPPKSTSSHSSSVDRTSPRPPQAVQIERSYMPSPEPAQVPQMSMSPYSVAWL